MKRIRWSWVWSYFRQKTKTRAQCKICLGLIWSNGLTTGNMNRHLTMTHKLSSDDIKQKRRSQYSWIWYYFEQLSQKQARCKFCPSRINCTVDRAFNHCDRHLKLKHNKTTNDNDWVWKAFEEVDENMLTCKICQFECIKCDDYDESIKSILDHLSTEHGIICSDQIIIEIQDEEDKEYLNPIYET